MRSALAVVLVTGLVFACQPKEKAPRNDKENLQGTWVLTSATVEGKEKTDEFVKVGYRAVIKGDQITLGGGDDIRTATFSIDPTGQPKTFDMSLVSLGIYDLKGDELKLCFGSGRRPTEFKAGSQSAFFVFKRAKKPEK